MNINFNFNRKYTLQAHILIIFITILMCTCITIIGYNHIANTKAVTNLGATFLAHIHENLIDKINDQLLNTQLLLNFGDQTYNNENEVNLDNANLIGFMREVLRNKPHLTSICTATKSGKFLQLRRTFPEDYYFSRRDKKVPPDSVFAIRYMDLSLKKPIEIWKYENLNKKILDTESVENPAYDPRTREWFQTTKENNIISWGDIYIFADGNIGRTTSSPVYEEKTKNFIGAFSIDISMKNMSEFLKAQKIGDKYTLAIINSKKEIIAHSKILQTTKIKNGKINIDLVDKTEDLVLKQAVDIFEDNQLNTFAFKKNNTKYFASFKSFPEIITTNANGKVMKTNPNKDWNLVIIVEEEEFLSSIHDIQFKLLLISIGILFLSVFIIIILVRRITKPIVQLAEEANKIRKFDLTSNKEMKSQIYEIELLNSAISSMRISMRSFSKFIPKVLVGKLLKSNHEIKIGGRSIRTTFFFTDIASFTSICENYAADKLSAHLSEYFEEITKIIFSYNGIIDKYIGDAVMAFWGAPEKDKDQSLNACKAALAIQKRLNDLNQQWDSQGKPVFNTRIGIHVGEAIVGNMGSSDRLNYTALGDTVNLAARLEGANKLYHTSVIISESVFKEIEGTCLARPLDIVAVKGKSECIEIYELVGITKDEPSLLPSKNQIAFCTLFSKGYKLYKEKRWDEAIEIFREIHKKFGEDYTAHMYINRCKDFKKNPPPPDWNGIFVLKEK